MGTVQLVRPFLWMMLLLHATAPTASAGPVKEVIEYFMKKFGPDLAEEGVEQTTRRLDDLVFKYGDEVLDVVKPLGPRAVTAADEFGAAGVKILKEGGEAGFVVLRRNGDEAVKLANKYGDEAVGVIVHQPGIARELLQAYPKDAFPAIAKLTSDEAVHLAKLAPDFAKLPAEARATFVEKLSQGGDDFVAWVWKRKTEIFGAGALAAGVIAVYKVGDGYSEGVKGAFPKAPDPEKSPGAWMFLVALLIGGPLAIVALVLYLRHRRMTAAPHEKDQGTEKREH